MKHPPYHLRPNKAVDRLLLIEALRHLGTASELARYSYFGLGGPYLEDFRIMHENFPRMRMVSIEMNGETVKRQRFHQPSANTQLVKSDFGSFVRNFDARNKRSIFWLDYVGFRYSEIADFITLLSKVTIGSVVKISVRADPEDYEAPEQIATFRSTFQTLLPTADAVPPVDQNDLVAFVQSILRIATQVAFPPASEMTLQATFQPISSFYYADRAGMYTLTGVVCDEAEQAEVRAKLADWPHANFEWSAPRHIDLPELSTKERLHLQRKLPHSDGSGAALTKRLGYLIAADTLSTERKLANYGEFYRYYPYLVKAVP